MAESQEKLVSDFLWNDGFTLIGAATVRKRCLTATQSVISLQRVSPRGVYAKFTQVSILPCTFRTGDLRVACLGND